MEQTAAAVLSKYLWAPFALVASWVWNDQRKHKEVIEDMRLDVATLKVSSMTEDKTREIISDVVSPLKDDNTEIKEAIKANAGQAATIYTLLNEMKVDLARRDGRDEGR
jgi:acetyl-CoA carboxylase alpha subunit